MQCILVRTMKLTNDQDVVIYLQIIWKNIWIITRIFEQFTILSIWGTHYLASRLKIPIDEE